MAGSMEVGQLFIPVELKLAREATQRLKAESEQHGRVMGVATAEAYVKASESRLNTNLARIKLAQAAGFMTPAQATEAARQAHQAFNAEILRGFQQANTTLRAGPQIVQTFGNALRNGEVQARRMGLGINSLREPLTTAVYMMTGANPVVARLASVVGSFALGSGLMIAVLAGLAALGAAWNRLTRDAREAREAQDEAIEGARAWLEQRQLERAGPFAEQRQQLEQAEARLRDVAERVRRAQLPVVDQYGNVVQERGTVPAQLQQELTEAAALVRDLRRDIDAAMIAGQLEGDQEMLRLMKEGHEQRLRELERQARELIEFVERESHRAGIDVERARPGVFDPRRTRQQIGDLGPLGFGRDDQSVRQAASHLNRMEAEDRQAREQADEDSATALRERLELIREQARALEENARAALQVAAALGLVDAGAAQAIEAIAQGAGSVVRLLGGDLSAIPSLVGAVAQLLGAGGGEVDPERARVTRENTMALERLRDGVARLSESLLSERGSDIVAMRRLIPRFVGPLQTQETEFGPISFQLFDLKGLENELNKLGLTLEDAKRIAASLGVTLDDTAQSYLDFIEALKRDAIQQLFDTASGRQRILGAEAQLFDQTDPQKLAALREAFLELGEFGEDVEAYLASFDLNTEAGRAGFREAMREMWKRFVEDPDAFLDRLGKLGTEGFIDWILSMDNLSESVNEAAEAFGALLNVPTGWKVALETFRATSVIPLGGPGGLPRRPLPPGGIRDDLSNLMPGSVTNNTTMTIENVNIQGVRGEDEGRTIVEKFARELTSVARRGGATGFLPAIMRR